MLLESREPKVLEVPRVLYILQESIKRTQPWASVHQWISRRGSRAHSEEVRDDSVDVSVSQGQLGVRPTLL